MPPPGKTTRSTPPPATSTATPARTLEGAYVRPRHNGYMAFQDAASKRLNAGLMAREAPAAILADIDRMFRESF